MNEEELQVAAFEIILHSGTARTEIHEAFDLMRGNHFSQAEEKLEIANVELVEAHHAQTKLLQDYASGVEIKIEIIMVHAQDHLMTTMTLLEVAKEMLELHKKVK
ncbi:PTS cellobiose transporter subunit IIA [Streptococcus sanguinis]|uniref:PTS cellobiose transporter subunit IIA n=1 Tax=Streptococcus sanguinis TaxID=1305 RepID=A0A7H8V269_STRSA|nr:PTS cellobiose transporter subunit IIA [Streptococcus sanguinis]QLB50458.1 PTS cellobiose transporter subunit IIA [Streptococcus sanguinis]